MKLMFLLLLIAAALPPGNPKPVFRAETNMMLVPVVARDAKGGAVGNLTSATVWRGFSTRD